MARVECLSDYSLPRDRWYGELRFSAVSCKLLMKTADFKSAEVYREIIKKARKAGFVFRRNTGGTHEIKPGTVKSIIKQMVLTKKEFEQL